MRECLHCKRTMHIQGRGLCARCYNVREIRDRYPKGKHYQHVGEPTEAELDLIIAEQMTCLPKWWQAERDKMAALQDPSGDE